MGALFLGEWGRGGICAFSNHITLQHMAIEGRSTEKTAAVTFSRNLKCLSLLKLQPGCDIVYYNCISRRATF